MSSNPHVIGMDTNSFGFHWTSTRDVSGRRWGWTRAGDSDQVRQAQVFWHAYAFFNECPDGVAVFCEAPAIMHQNIKTTMVLVASAHTIWSAFVASRRDGTWTWVPITEWRKEILGRGTPPKGVKAKPWVEDWTNVDGSFLDFFRDDEDGLDLLNEPDLREAWCLMVYGRRQLARA